MLCEGLPSAINESFGSPEKKFSVNFRKANTKNNDHLFLNEKEIFKFKADNKNFIFATQFCLGSLSNRFGATESSDISLKGHAYYFSFNYNSIDKSEILNIHKYLMVQNNIK